MKNELEERTKQFALAVIASSATLPRDRATDVLARQLLRSGTSIGANYREAGRAQSHDDFIHKIAICEKEAAETEYWIELIIDSHLGSVPTFEKPLDEVRELLAIFVASGRTAKSRR
jgi:four helix bundle protein